MSCWGACRARLGLHKRGLAELAALTRLSAFPMLLCCLSVAAKVAGRVVGEAGAGVVGSGTCLAVFPASLRPTTYSRSKLNCRDLSLMKT